MKRFVPPLATLAFLVQLGGCGPDTVPEPIGANRPSEIKDFDARRQSEREKQTSPKAP